jgi:hypothetical protein
MSLNTGAQIAIAVCVTAGAVALLGGLLVFWRRRAARRRDADAAALQQSKLHVTPIYEAPGSADTGMPTSTTGPEPEEMWVAPVIHELGTGSRTASPAMAHHRDFSFATVGTQQHQHEQEERDREMQEHYQQYHQYLSPDVSPETQAVSPIDRSTTRSASEENVHLHHPPG